MNKPQIKSFSAKCSQLSNVLISKIAVINAVKKNNQVNVIAIWDTGAMRTGITKKMAIQLNLITIGQSTISTPTGNAIRNDYAVDIVLPNNVLIPSVKVVEIDLKSADVLIGMDIITLGDFAVSNYNGKTTFSFRVPSCKETDYTKEKVFSLPAKREKIGRNDLCPCGSGKKYKFCCAQKEVA